MAKAHLFKNSSKRTFILFLIIFQSCGIRFFDGQGYCLGIIIFLMSYNNIFYINKKDILILISIASYLFVSKLLNQEFSTSSLIYQILLITEAYLYVLNCKNENNLSEDLFKTLNLFFINALCGYVLFSLFPTAFTRVIIDGMSYITFSYLFFLADSNAEIRNSGLCWEPGLLQLMLNLLLFLNIRSKTRSWRIILLTITIISTFSTAGFIILSLNILFYIRINFFNKKKMAILLTLFLVVAIPISLIRNNISEKFSGSNTSGLVRYRDFLIGLELIKEKPVLGHGKFESTYLLNKSYTSKLESSVFPKEYYILYNGMSGGYTNGLLGLLSWYGLPLGITIFLMFYKNVYLNKKENGRIIFFLIFCFTLISEPITYTAFFLLFPFSYIISKTRIYKHRS